MCNGKILPITLISQNNFIAWIECPFNWYANFEMFTLEICVQRDCYQVQALADEVALFLSHYFK